MGSPKRFASTEPQLKPVDRPNTPHAVSPE